MGGWETWKWDESLFAGAAEHYDAGRLPYPPGLADGLSQALGLDGRGRLLDLGCGPGTVTLRVADRFEEVVGVDPDAGMVAEAQRLAAERGITNARFVKARAEELPELGRFRTVTLVQSFHWMNRPLVAARCLELLEPGGAVVLPDTSTAVREIDRARATHPAPPDDEIDKLRIAYLGADRRAGQSIRNTSPSGEDEVFQAAGFAPVESVTVADDRELVRNVDEIVHLVLSSSFTAPHLFGDRLDEFVSDLRRVLFDASPSGQFSYLMGDIQLRIWRPAGATTDDR